MVIRYRGSRLLISAPFCGVFYASAAGLRDVSLRVWVGGRGSGASELPDSLRLE